MLFVCCCSKRFRYMKKMFPTFFNPVLSSSAVPPQDSMHLRVKRRHSSTRSTDGACHGECHEKFRAPKRLFVGYLGIIYNWVSMAGNITTI